MKKQFNYLGTILFLVMFSIIIMITILTSFEKVVVLNVKGINNSRTDGVMYKYRVNRISKGVVDFIYEYNAFEVGDTIFHRFTK